MSGKRSGGGRRSIRSTGRLSIGETRISLYNRRFRAVGLGQPGQEVDGASDYQASV